MAARLGAVATIVSDASSQYLRRLALRGLVPDEGYVRSAAQLVEIENHGIEEYFSEEAGQSPELMYIGPQWGHGRPRRDREGL